MRPVGSEPLLLVVMGRIGTGKTTVARQLASELDWPVFSSDEIRKTLAGVPLNVRTAPELRDKVYSEQMTDQTYAKLLENGLAALAIAQRRCSRRDVFQPPKARARCATNALRAGYPVAE